MVLQSRQAVVKAAFLNRDRALSDVKPRPPPFPPRPIGRCDECDNLATILERRPYRFLCGPCSVDLAGAEELYCTGCWLAPRRVWLLDEETLCKDCFQWLVHQHPQCRPLAHGAW